MTKARIFKRGYHWWLQLPDGFIASTRGGFTSFDEAIFAFDAFRYRLFLLARGA